MDLIIVEAPGKRDTWNNFLKRQKIPARVIATRGGICDFPSRMTPLGINIFAQDDKPVDFGRRLKEEKAEALLAAVRRTDGKIYIATDSDPEGAAIAYDIAMIIGNVIPNARTRCYRIYLRSMAMRDLVPAMGSAQQIFPPQVPGEKVRQDVIQRMVDEAVEGRARAVTDRWIGAALSRHSGVPIGRIRTSVPGTVALHVMRNPVLRGPVELGEVILHARSSSGGKHFCARVPVLSNDDPDRVRRLVRIGRKFAGKYLPGKVYMPQSVGAAIAPRFGDVRPFSTGDAVAHAGRHHGLRPHVAMAGLHRAYMRGDVSYPKTDSRVYSVEIASRVCILGSAYGLRGLSAAAAVEIDDAFRGQEALYPAGERVGPDAERIKAMLRKDWSKILPPYAPKGEMEHDPHPETVADLMTVLVARRAFEASRDVTVEYGYWRTGNDVRSTDLDQEDCDLLENLDWEREMGAEMPWSRDMGSGIRVWPGESVILDMMMTEDLARPFTLPSHLKTVMDAGHIQVKPVWQLLDQEDPFELPILSPLGKKTLKRAPEHMWMPAIGRMIARAIRNEGGRLPSDPAAGVSRNLRIRVLAWLVRMPEPIRDILALGMSKDDEPIDRMLEKEIEMISRTDQIQTALDVALPQDLPGSAAAQPRH